MSPALPGGFSTTAPPGKPLTEILDLVLQLVKTTSTCNQPSLIKLILIFATEDLHVLQATRSLYSKMFAQVVFQELGLSCVQFKLKPVKSGWDH